MKIVTSGFGNVPRLAKLAFEKPVNLRNVASCVVISSCIVHTILHMQSFSLGGGRLLRRQYDRRLEINLTKSLNYFSSRVSCGTWIRQTLERRLKRNQDDM